MSQEERRNQTVWLDEQQWIASFHSVEGYHQRDFVCYDFFYELSPVLTGTGISVSIKENSIAKPIKI